MDLIYIVLALFVGWNIPMPQWAKNFQASAITWVKGLFIRKAV